MTYKDGIHTDFNPEEDSQRDINISQNTSLQLSITTRDKIVKAPAESQNRAKSTYPSQATTVGSESLQDPVRETTPEVEIIPYQVRVLVYWITKKTPIFSKLKSCELNNTAKSFLARLIFSSIAERAAQYALERGLPAYQVSVMATPYYEKITINRRFPVSIEPR